MDNDDLTEEQSNALAHFQVEFIELKNQNRFQDFSSQEFTQIESTETAIQYLSAHNWDVERAIDTALVSNSEPPTPETPITTTQLTPTIPTTTTTTNNNISIITRYIPARALYVRRNFKKFVNFSFYRQLSRMPSSA